MILASYSHMAVATPSATRSVGLGRSLMANLDRGWTFAGPPGSEETASTRRPRGGSGWPRGSRGRTLRRSRGGVDFSRFRVSVASGSSRPVGQLLKRPPIAVRVGEVDEASPRLLVDRANFDAALQEVSARSISIDDHHL